MGLLTRTKPFHSISQQVLTKRQQLVYEGALGVEPWIEFAFRTHSILVTHRMFCLQYFHNIRSLA